MLKQGPFILYVIRTIRRQMSSYGGLIIYYLSFIFDLLFLIYIYIDFLNIFLVFIIFHLKKKFNNYIQNYRCL